MDGKELIDMESGVTTHGRFIDNKFIKLAKAVAPPKYCAGDLYDRIWDASCDASKATMNPMFDKVKVDVKLQWKVNPSMFFDPIWIEFTDGNMEVNIFNPVADIGGDFLFSDNDVLKMFVDGSTKDDVEDMDFFQCSTLFFLACSTCAEQSYSYQFRTF